MELFFMRKFSIFIATAIKNLIKGKSEEEVEKFLEGSKNLSY